MATLYAMLWLLTVHFVADFVLQSDWMAQNKSKRNDALALHVTIYTATFLLLGGLPLLRILDHPGGPVFGLWLLFNGAAHFATDYVTSRISSRLWAAKQVHNFFVCIGADQLIHALTLGLTMAWLLR
jgi:hypothetical protein